MFGTLPIGYCAPGVMCNFSQCGVLLSIILLISCILWAMYFSHLQTYSSGARLTHVPVVVFKLPRSGSSWITDSLNRYNNVFISKEIVQSSDGSRFPVSVVEEHFVNALKKPTGKLSSVGDVLPSKRFMDDYIFHSGMKPFRTMDVIGFTLNPEHSEGLDWGKIAKEVPKFKVIMLRRSNLIKSAISGYTGSAIKKECGSSNLRSGSDCKPEIRVGWTVDELAEEVRQWQLRYQLFDNTVVSHPALKDRVVYHLYYENLQTQPQETMRLLFDALNIPDYPIQAVDGSTWEKRSTDDLSKMLDNFDAIKEAFTRGGCTCLLEMLVAVEPVVYAEPCKEVWRDNKCHSQPSA